MLAANTANAQALFQHKVSTCHDIKYCFDCGLEKASYREEKFDLLLDNIMRVKDMNTITDNITFQIVIDSVGNGCVISYDAHTSQRLVFEIVRKLNMFNGWIPAKGGNPKASAIILELELSKGTGMARVSRPNEYQMLLYTYSAGKPKIANKKYDYTNAAKDSYEFAPFTVANAELPHNMAECVSVDSDGTVWLGTYNGLVALRDSTMQYYDSSNATFLWKERTMVVEEAAVATDNAKWFEAGDEVHVFNDSVWRTFDTTALRVGRIHNLTSDAWNNVYISGRNGVMVANGVSWKFLDPAKFNLPSKQVYFANRDRQKRIWIGTFGGSAMMDSTGKMTQFGFSATPLSDACITAMAEDETGNVWFAVRELRQDIPDALVRYSKEGTWQQFTMDNSGLPNKTINALLFDKKEQVIWLAVEGVGLVRFDGANDWQVYTNENSTVLSTSINNLAQDANGAIWCATLYGLLRVTKK